MSTVLKLPNGNSTTAIQSIYSDLHRLFLVTKLSHYDTRSYAAHGAFGRLYDAMNDLVDEITEKLIGYSGTDPVNLQIGTVNATTPKDLADQVMAFAEKLRQFATEKKYSDIDNLAQDLSGEGAQLKYLSRFP